jgi:hypothetical protein
MIYLCSVYLYTFIGVQEHYIHMMSVSFNSRTSVGRSYVASILPLIESVFRKICVANSLIFLCSVWLTIVCLFIFF